jgi:hypothetical protein
MILDLLVCSETDLAQRNNPLENTLGVQRFKVTQPSPFQKVERYVEQLAVTVDGDPFMAGFDQLSLESSPLINRHAG